METTTLTVFIWVLLAAAVIVAIVVSSWTTYRFVLLVQRVKARKGQNSALWESSPFEEEHFDESTIQVDLSGCDPKSLIGLELTRSEIIALSGATSGSRVTAKYMSHRDWSNESTGEDRPPPGLFFEVNGPLIDTRTKQTVGIFQEPSGHPGLYVKDIFFTDTAPAGLAGRMLVRMVRASIGLGILELSLLAAGGRTWPSIVGAERWIGYLAWAIYGFDMPLLAQTRALLSHFPYFPANLGSCYTVQNVLQVDSGRDFWRIVGDGWFMRFDASHPDTASVKALLRQVAKKGV